MAESTEKPFGHEPDAIAYRPVLIAAGTLVLFVIACAIGLHFALRNAAAPNYPQAVTRPAPIPPPPRLEAHPQRDLAEFRARKEAILSSYRWLDAGHHYARIPIQRAMQIYAAQHAHASAPAASNGAPASPSSSANRAAHGAPQ
ncbi:MAG TPA: hypothetical protein VKV22_04235 [Rhodanobacteraceae bacterium]|nr:hypothetical protein [Rhodanobacteraceae bacterium]